MSNQDQFPYPTIPSKQSKSLADENNIKFYQVMTKNAINMNGEYTGERSHLEAHLKDAKTSEANLKQNRNLNSLPEKYFSGDN